MIVLDASAAVDLLTNSRAHWAEHSTGRMTRVLDLHAPDILLAEVASALRGASLGGRLDARLAVRALHGLEALPVQLTATRTLLLRAWDLRRTVAFDHALYIALAERLELPLYTSDSRLARSHGHDARIVDLTAPLPPS